MLKKEKSQCCGWKREKYNCKSARCVVIRWSAKGLDSFSFLVATRTAPPWRELSAACARLTFILPAVSSTDVYIFPHALTPSVLTPLYCWSEFLFLSLAIFEFNFCWALSIKAIQCIQHSADRICERNPRSLCCKLSRSTSQAVLFPPTFLWYLMLNYLNKIFLRFLIYLNNCS